jgi:CRP-like cAMP-binding protein
MSSKPKKSASQESRNLVLSSLPPDDAALIAAELTPTRIDRNAVVFEPYRSHERVYFPTDSSITFLGDTGDGGRVEVWSVGNEGVAGLSALIGETKPFRGVVQVAGNALSGNALRLRRYFHERHGFHDAVVRYYHSLLIQVSLLGICNSSHSVEQRLSRWLLMVRERAGTSVLNFTQDYIAGVLGTRRATISVAAAALQTADLISYTPGSITIKSRKGLQAVACSCHKLIRSWR